MPESTARGDGVPAEAPEADHIQSILDRPRLGVDALEEEIREAPGGIESTNVMRLFDRLRDPEPSVRLTALQWLVGRPEARVDALAATLHDPDPTVRMVAAELILGFGMGEDATVDDLVVTVEKTDPEGLRQLLTRMLPP